MIIPIISTATPNGKTIFPKTENQTNFIETTLGKTVNLGLDIGLRALLPDYIEQQIIDINLYKHLVK